MRISFQNQLDSLRKHLNRFDPASSAIRSSCLHQLAKRNLPSNSSLPAYHDALMFICAHPADKAQYHLAEKELLRIAAYLKKASPGIRKRFANTGLPFTDTVTRYSHDGLRWLLQHPHCNVTLESFEDPLHELNDVLRLTLPPLERSETTAGLGNVDLMTVLRVPKQRQLDFIVEELSRFDHLPHVKDHLFDRLDTFVRVTPRDITFSRSFNRLPGVKLYLQQDWFKTVHTRDILDTSLPKASAADPTLQKEIIRVIRDAMAVTARETDPTTFMMESSLRLFHLERGISIALYDMVPHRQLPLESYVGYTAFKNGFPVAYGGAWVFGHRAHFGINIFEAFRGGESAYILAQLLRTYRHVFDLRYFEIEPYQFGLDNPEGIASGAFWFYYRMGFRPLDRDLRALAQKEAEKIRTRKAYKTPPGILVKFTGSSIGLRLEKKVPPPLADIMVQVTKMIRSSFHDRRMEAEKECRDRFLSLVKNVSVMSTDEHAVLTDIAMWAAANRIEDEMRLHLMQQMIREKPRDVYAYQALLRRFFDTVD